MAGEPTDPAAEHLRSSQPREPVGEADVVALARCHRLCLPETASSRAGLSVLEGLYRALIRDRDAEVVWRPGDGAEPHLGAFAAGTVALRETELAVRRSLSAVDFARLALRVAAMPMHVLARRRWEQVIPSAGIGYVLTLGSAAAVTGHGRGARGRDVLADLEAWFVARGARESWVDTEQSNGRAIEFYRRGGYVEVSRDYGQVLLKKPLPSG